VAYGLGNVTQKQLPTLAPKQEPTSTGVFHVHSEASHDSQLTLKQIANAAAAAGLSFVVLTDHNKQMVDGVEINGITFLSFAELSTPYGHAIQLGAHEPLTKQERTELTLHDIVRERGGRSFLAHPSDPKRPWVGPMRNSGGLEIANIAATARHKLLSFEVFSLLPSVAAAPLNWELAVAQLYGRDVKALQRWDAEPDPSFVGICGADAHGRLLDLTLTLRAWRVVLDSTLPADPKHRAANVVKQLIQGSFSCAAGMFADDPQFRFGARLNGKWSAGGGETVTIDEADELIVLNPISQDARTQAVLLRNGHEIMRTRSRQLRYVNPTPGTYRSEIRIQVPFTFFGNRPETVIYSNRIRITGP
jgi:hypothetical protein